jgi:16S rRNA (cytosine967-C5)-methyltransferase
MPSPSPAVEEDPGLLPRAEAVRLINAVLRRGAQLDQAFASSASQGNLSNASPRDRRLCYAIVAYALRRKGEIDLILRRFLSKPLPKSAGLAPEILLTTAAQLLFMRIPSHAAVGLAVKIAKADQRARHFADLINAVGRKLASIGLDELPPIDPSINTPAWLFDRWVEAFGEETARSIALAHLSEPPLDLTVIGDANCWASRLGGTVAGGQTVRLGDWHGSVSDLPGFNEGQWWVQDEAAAIPARLLGDVMGKRVLDLCAAPGGKTAQLVHAGAHVTALDRSPEKMCKLQENLARLKFSAETIIGDALYFEAAELFDAVLLDAPCSATGIIRRHPDIPYHRTPKQIFELAGFQGQILSRASNLVKHGGRLVFCTCSLELEEGERHLNSLPADLRLLPLSAGEHSLKPEWVASSGCLRTRPNQGLDGFFAMLLLRI